MTDGQAVGTEANFAEQRDSCFQQFVEGRTATTWPKWMGLRPCAGENSVQIQEFIDKYRDTREERANKDMYLSGLCRVLGVPEPNAKTGDPERDHYVFEADSILYDEDGRRHVGKMDLYKSGHFVLEAKQTAKKGKPGAAQWKTPGWNLAMADAAGQAFGYARTLDAPPPFVVVADIGNCFDVYACFDGTGAYRAFPNAQKHRLWLKELDKHADMLRKIWIDPMSLDPSRYSERVTHEVAADLAELATALEASGHEPEIVTKFLMRCIFTMFVEDIGLLQDNVFTKYLELQWLNNPSSFKDGIEELWLAMNAGKRFYVLGKLLKFNGGLFADPVGIDLTAKQLRVLVKAAKHNWSQVEPAIFGTLIERALNPKERHRLGAHFTPAEYVRRLVRPTIEEPLRAEWDLVRIAVRQLVPPGEPSKPGNVAKARAAVEAFRKQLCEAKVLDPACGTGNFLYEAFHIFKQLESEALSLLDDLGLAQLQLTDDLTVTPRQFLGIELRTESKEIAELVLWIGYLQWHHKMFGGEKKPPEPILRDYKNIDPKDAVLEWDGVPKLTTKTRWDGVTHKVHPSTGLPVPDELARVADYRYDHPRRAHWPTATFIVGNPPYVGNKGMRLTLGDGYVEALRKAWPEVPESADYVAYWLQCAGQACAAGTTQRVGLICTSSITQIFNRRILSKLLDRGLSVAFAIPEHPWVSDQEGAAVTVAMLVLEKADGAPGVLATAVGSDLTVRSGVISSSLRIGPRVEDAFPLRANAALSCRGIIVLGKDFQVDEAKAVSLKTDSGCLRPFINVSVLLDQSPRRWVIDVDHLDEDELRETHPVAYQWLLQRVFPFRQQQRNPERKRMWWKFARRNRELRAAIRGLRRYIVVPYNPKHIQAYFVDGSALPDDGLVAIGTDDAYHLGVLCSRPHVLWAMRAGTRLGKGNTPRYNNTSCFDTFPFPPEGSAVIRDRIRALGEAIDAHRKERQAQDGCLPMTEILNVLEKLRRGEALTPKERSVNDRGLVALLRKLHDDLDSAVAVAYGWASEATDDEILERLVALNTERAAEERARAGLVRWLRPDFQLQMTLKKPIELESISVSSRQLSLPWPLDLPHQAASVRELINATDVALSANDVAASYEGASAESVVAALQTLEALGLAVSYQNGSKRWKGLAKATGERIVRSQEGRPISRPPPATGTA